MGTIEARHLTPHVNRHLATLREYDMNDEVSISPITQLALRAGVDEEVIRRIANGKAKTIQFDMADSIICAMGDARVWYSLGEVTHTVCGFEFRDVYWGCDLTAKKAGGQTKKQLNSAHCPNGHLKADHTGVRGDGRKYCKECYRVKEEQRRRARGVQPMKTHCVNGHKRTKDNTYIDKRGYRSCKICRQANTVAHRATKGLM